MRPRLVEGTTALTLRGVRYRGFAINVRHDGDRTDFVLVDVPAGAAGGLVVSSVEAPTEPVTLVAAGARASFAAAGARTLFGVAGGIGLDASATALADAGFTSFAGPLAWVLAVGQLVLGVLLVLGLLTPFAAAGLLATKGVAVVVALVPALSVPLFASDGANSLELDLLLGAGAAALVFAGAGRIALDAGRTYQRRPLPWSVLSLLVAVAVALLVLFVLRR